LGKYPWEVAVGENPSGEYLTTYRTITVVAYTVFAMTLPFD